MRLQEVLSAAVSNVGRLSLRDLVERTWVTLGGPATLQDRNEREDAETFFGFWSSSNKGYDPRFQFAEREIKGYAQSPVGDDCVKVMTIHEAKGLEFDTVIVPRLGAQTKRDSADSLSGRKRFKRMRA